MTKLFSGLLVTVCLLGCGSSVTETSDAGTDASSDASGDLGVTDTGGAVTDSGTTVTDTGAPSDARPDIPLPDTGVAMSPECKTAGGALCTEHRWTICPPGYEPIGVGDGHLACSTGGWCCVVAPFSTCTSSGKGNCVVGDCKGCWSKVSDPSLTCESGRTCCEDICD